MERTIAAKLFEVAPSSRRPVKMQPPSSYERTRSTMIVPSKFSLKFERSNT